VLSTRARTTGRVERQAVVVSANSKRAGGLLQDQFSAFGESECVNVRKLMCKIVKVQKL
jgi:hypothetical protein